MSGIKRRFKVYCFLIGVSFFINFCFLSNAFCQIVLEDSLMNGNNYEKASFRLWVSTNVKTIQGIIVMMPGSNSDGRSMVDDTLWQHLAVRHNFALLGCYYKDKHHEHMEIEEYANVRNGSGQALTVILQNFSVKSKHAELAQAPLALWGMSAGGEFNYEFVCWKPERVIAFIVNKGGIYYSSLAPPAAWKVPGLFFTGGKDSPFRNNIVKGIFSINRRFGAKWCFIEEPNAAHEFEKSEEFARFFFDRIIPLRLSTGSKTTDFPIQNISAKGYIGIINTRELFPEDTNHPAELTSWFPDQIMAEKWVDFIK